MREFFKTNSLRNVTIQGMLELGLSLVLLYTSIKILGEDHIFTWFFMLTSTFALTKASTLLIILLYEDWKK